MSVSQSGIGQSPGISPEEANINCFYNMFKLKWWLFQRRSAFFMKNSENIVENLDEEPRSDRGISIARQENLASKVEPGMDSHPQFPLLGPPLGRVDEGDNHQVVEELRAHSGGETDRETGLLNIQMDIRPSIIWIPNGAR